MIRQKTLATLKKLNIPNEKVHIFVDPDQVEAYKMEFASEGYKVCKGDYGTRKNREAIVKYFAEGTHVISLDDDIEKILLKSRAGMDASTAIREMKGWEWQELIKVREKLTFSSRFLIRRQKLHFISFVLRTIL
jgi:Fe2+ or Zn2+ uptake regulation protein